MSKEIKEVEVMEAVEETAIEEVEVKTSFMSKVGAGVKKHGKKLAIGAGVAAMGLLCFALGKKAVGNNYGCNCGDDTDEYDFGGEETYSDETAE